MTTHNFRTHLLPALLSGARNGLPLDRVGLTSNLQALALTAQALRFYRPGGPAQFQVEEAVNDSRALVPEKLRRPLLRLLTAKASGMAPDALPSAVARTLAAHRLRLHPFDLPRLESFVRAHAEYLGAQAMAFAQRETAATDKRGYFEPDALDDRTWMLATPAVRQGYIEKRRREDAEAARVLVEAVWTSENADIRVRLLSALREGLSAGDAKFLQGLDKDRAPRVRELALRLLARLPGGSGDHPALRAAVKRIRKGQSGFFRKQTTLALELPATVKPPAAPGWIHETFGELSLDELARALNLSISDMVEAATKDEHLLLAFAIIATRDKAFTVLEGLVAALPQAWELMAQAGLNDLDGLTDDERRRWAALILRSAEWDAGQSLWVLVRLHQLLRTTVSEVMMGALLKSRPWQFALKDNARLTPDTVELMAALCPPSRRGALRTQLAGLDPAKTGHALNFLELMNGLETSHGETNHV